jgi:hypothetical protein
MPPEPQTGVKVFFSREASLHQNLLFVGREYMLSVSSIDL